jgi:ABC-type phosphate transport system substrate-binding protein
MQIDILPRWLRRTMALGVLTVAVSGCSGADGAAEPAADAAPVDITGAGATFPYPLYSRWFEEYNRRHPMSASTTRRSARVAASGRCRTARSSSAPPTGP